MPDAHLPSDEPWLQSAGPFAALLGWVLGTALQLQQVALWPAWGYAALALPAGFLAVALWRRTLEDWPTPRRRLAWCLAAAALGFACTGLRSLAFDAQALNPALEGRDVLLTGVVTDMPQRNEVGLRFTLDVDSATLDGQAVQLPPRMDVGWYGGVYSLAGEQVSLQRQPGDVRTGERWRMTVRLRAPHGSRNPHGFDYELWMWERGVQASSYVRAGATDPEPQRLEQTWTHPVALLRQTVRERIASQVEQRQFAGLIAALVVGDQNAIDRWWLTIKFCSGISLISMAFRYLRSFEVTLKSCSGKC